MLWNRSKRGSSSRPSLSRGTAGDDVLVARRSTDQTQIELWLNANPDTTSPTHTYSRNDTTAFLFAAGNGNDKLVLDASSGTPFHDNVLAFDGGAGTDTFEVVHHASSASRVSYFPSETDADAGKILTGRRAASFDSVESILASNVTTLTLTTPNSNDDLRIDSPFTQTSRIRESGLVSGNIVFTPLTFSATKTLVLDTAFNDGDTPGTDIIKVEGSGLTSIAPRPSTSDPAVATDLRPYVGEGTNTLRLSAGTLALSAGSTIDSGQTLDVITDAGTLSITATQYLKSLTLNGSAQVAMPKVALASSTTPASPHKVLVLGALSIDTATGATATLDLADNAAIVLNGNSSSLESLVRRAMNEAAYPNIWTGHGITSSTAAANPNDISAIGIVRPADVSPLDPGEDSSGQALADTDVLLKFSYFGDVNLDGVVDGTDYYQIDANFGTSVGHWINGDFTLDGNIDGSDYFLIDTANGSAPDYRPTFSVSGNSTVNEGSSYTLSATASTGTGIPAISAWSIYWGDGSHSVHANDGTPITHTYADDGGPYTIQAFAKGPAFNYTAGSTTVTVNNVAPNPTITGATSANEGSIYTLNLASTDPGSDVPYRWIIDWGDGSTSSIDGDLEQAQHTYADDGTYSIETTFYDDDTRIDLPIRTLSVADVAPVFTPSGPSSIAEGRTYILNLAVTEPGNDPITWIINWGDGSAPEEFDGDTLVATHNFYGTEGAAYSISVSASGEGGISYQPVTVPVTMGPVGTQKYRISPSNPNGNGVLISGELQFGSGFSQEEYVEAAAPEQAVEMAIESFNSEPSYNNEIHVFPGPERATEIETYSASFPEDLNASSGPSFRIVRESGSGAMGYTVRIELVAPDGVVDVVWFDNLTPLPTVSVVKVKDGSEHNSTDSEFKFVSSRAVQELNVAYSFGGTALEGAPAGGRPGTAKTCTVEVWSPHNGDFIDTNDNSLEDGHIVTIRGNDQTIGVSPSNDCYDEGPETIIARVEPAPLDIFGEPTYKIAEINNTAEARQLDLFATQLRRKRNPNYTGLGQLADAFAILSQASNAANAQAQAQARQNILDYIEAFPDAFDDLDLKTRDPGINEQLRTQLHALLSRALIFQLKKGPGNDFSIHGPFDMAPVDERFKWEVNVSIPLTAVKFVNENHLHENGSTFENFDPVDQVISFVIAPKLVSIEVPYEINVTIQKWDIAEGVHVGKKYQLDYQFNVFEK